jgi:hypothetical protein
MSACPKIKRHFQNVNVHGNQFYTALKIFSRSREASLYKMFGVQIGIPKQMIAIVRFLCYTWTVVKNPIG